MLALLVAAALAQDPPAARWTFTAGGAPGAKSLGRVDVADSPVGSGAKMLVLNGVDASLEVDPPGTLGAGGSDFTIALWICPLELRSAAILSRRGAWSVEMTKDGKVVFQDALGDHLETDSRVLSPHRWFHVAVLLEPRAVKKAGQIVVNGEPKGTGEIRGGDLDPAGAALYFGRGGDDQPLCSALLDDVRLYARCLAPGDVAALCDQGMPWVRPRPNPERPFRGGFSLDDQDVIVLAGGEDVLALQAGGQLEARLQAWAGPRKLQFRSMAWEGDTVFDQPRLLNFGGWRDQLGRVGAGIVVAQFGAMEALEGKPGLERFEAAYDRLMGEFAQATGRIVVLSPVPFEKAPAPLPDLSVRNRDLGLYVESMKAMAVRRHLLFVDLFGVAWGDRVTRDGIHLSGSGQVAVAREIARQLGARGKEPSPELLEAVQRKNRAWLGFWRPSNWAFLNGDRIEQPSSRDHLDRRIRWFPVEVQETLAAVRREEESIQKLLGQGR